MSQNRGPKFATSKIFFFSVRRKKNFCNTSSPEIDENYLISRYHVLLRLLRLADVRYTPPPPSLAFTQMRTFPFSDLRIPTLSLCIQSFCGEREKERDGTRKGKKEDPREEGRERRRQGCGSIDERGTLELFVKGRQRRLIDVSMELP